MIQRHTRVISIRFPRVNGTQALPLREEDALSEALPRHDRRFGKTSGAAREDQGAGRARAGEAGGVRGAVGGEVGEGGREGAFQRYDLQEAVVFSEVLARELRSHFIGEVLRDGGVEEEDPSGRDLHAVDQRFACKVVVDKSGDRAETPQPEGNKDEIRAVHEVHGDDFPRLDLQRVVQPAGIAKGEIVGLREGPLAGLIDEEEAVGDLGVGGRGFKGVEGINVGRFEAAGPDDVGEGEGGDEAVVVGEGVAGGEVGSKGGDGEEGAAGESWMGGLASERWESFWYRRQVECKHMGADLPSILFFNSVFAR